MRVPSRRIGRRIRDGLNTGPFPHKVNRLVRPLIACLDSVAPDTEYNALLQRRGGKRAETAPLLSHYNVPIVRGSTHCSNGRIAVHAART